MIGDQPDPRGYSMDMLILGIILFGMIVGAIPGGLFELTFGIWLIARGLASTATVRSRAST